MAWVNVRPADMEDEIAATQLARETFQRESGMADKRGRRSTHSGGQAEQLQETREGIRSS